MNDRKRAVWEHYERRAADYDGIYARQDASDDLYPANRVRLEVVLRCLARRGARTVLDAGCGTGEPLLEFLRQGYDARGFDFSPAIAACARRRLEQAGQDPDRVTTADIEHAETLPQAAVDAVVGKGLMPHELDDAAVYANIRGLLAPGGVFLAEYRNALMSLFSVNRHGARFLWRDLLRGDNLPEGLRQDALAHLAAKCDVTPDEVSAPAVSYGVLPRFHNPLTLGEEMAGHGLRLVACRFYHFHCAPPELESGHRQAFHAASRAMEHTDDWRGMFLCSAFIAEIEAAPGDRP